VVESAPEKKKNYKTDCYFFATYLLYSGVSHIKPILNQNLLVIKWLKLMKDLQLWRTYWKSRAFTQQAQNVDVADQSSDLK